MIVTYPDLLLLNGLSHQLSWFQLGQLLLWAQLVPTQSRQVVTPEGPAYYLNHSWSSPPTPQPSAWQGPFQARFPQPRQPHTQAEADWASAWLPTIRERGWVVGGPGAAETRVTGEILTRWLGLLSHRKRPNPITDKTLESSQELEANPGHR